jgi:hypothetical protein
MNKNIYDLMIAAGYAAPDLATRAQFLTQLIIDQCSEQIAHNAKINWLDAAQAAKDLRQHFGVEE